MIRLSKADPTLERNRLESTTDVLAMCDLAPTQGGACRNASGWAFTSRSIHGTLSPGVAAFCPGVTLLTTLPTSWLPSGAGAFNLTLQHLVSWKAMGVVEMRAIDACHSEAQRVDTSRFARDGGTNATIFVETSFTIKLNAAVGAVKLKGGSDVALPCRLLLRVLDDMSSGGHHFKIRDLVMSVNSGSPCRGISKVNQAFLARRSSKSCPDDMADDHP